MTGKTVDLVFDGYWREPNKGNVPAQSGIYCVYTCTPVTKDGKTTLTIHKLVYIGESADVRLRLASHEKLTKWQKHLKDDQQLCYSFAPIGSEDRVRTEAAMINKHTPPENSEYVGEYPYNKITINNSGRAASLMSTLTVE
ncbi:hypothetical protein DMS87_10535 [Klebsiella variicola]|uniref:GIY-YIG nuclease family protein n=1 Tax=Klebsiella variicola TaxID=244366 RepID=UPI000D7498D2|nr:GIY-YIG nuclease family protein [Klebsiella variicola]MDF8297941.1 GIY-YIG nuclease family protein [Klebsiella variicola]PXK36693.1 hypothetical protein DMR25_10960 [Klebsiella variicola]PXK80288.1 hypothetical protein DMS24_13730 [Klebsiella variicola]PXM50595.1 hypothetical protein DMS87_10535 [Klebsiella variicola]UDC26391.1 GIY-YIG nuclease family protein [Klebsiella variicola subsp. tropica]